MAETGLFCKQLIHHAGQVAAFCKRMSVSPVRAGDVISGRKMHADADRAGLLAGR